MAKAKHRDKCQGTTAKGTPCKRLAWKGWKFCALHGAKEAEIARATTPKKMVFAAAYQDIIDRSIREQDNPSDQSGVKMSWCRIQLDATKAAIEHQDRLDGLGTGVTYISITQPPGDKPKPPVEDDEPQRAIEGDMGDDSEGRVLN